MFSNESRVLPNSDYYIFTPSSTAKNLFLYPVSTGHFSYLPGYRLLRSSYDSFLLMYIRKGNCTVETNHKIYRACEGQIVIVDCYKPHAYYSNDGWDAEWLHFDGANARLYYEAIAGSEYAVLNLASTAAFEKYLRNIYMVFRNNEPINEAVLNKWIVDLLTELLLIRNNSKNSAVTTDFIEDTTAYIREHLNEVLPLNQLAARVNLSPFYFTRVFKAKTGFTPHEYIIASRVDNAKFLLMTTSHSVKEICFLSGFSNESAFCTTFRGITGLTPSDFRNSAGTDTQI
jgi:AraC family transcriptional regulator